MPMTTPGERVMPSRPTPSTIRVSKARSIEWLRTMRLRLVVVDTRPDGAGRRRRGMVVLVSITALMCHS